jgi:predicted enzyme related to lactoylglutathione lyase
MRITGLDLLFLEVNNLEESIHFYGDVLDLELEKDSSDGDPPMATFRAGNLKLTLAQQLESMLRRGRGAHFFVGVENVDQYFLELKSRGADVQPPIDEGWGGKFITLQDPDKYRFFFVSWAKEMDKR